ncbi:maleylpyruvate isomerase N-terminal domain-containing protein, partial [Ilumatobacter sp.]|uniref:maleylpyruvate isomerase N-terminal domain-containing protein n=1 Tax=Ilumatobacter sp. TaxID=1967498 RepID=UPI003C31A42C
MTATDSDVHLALRIERSRLCDMLEELDAAAWSTQSLCDDWNVHEVVAHLSLSTRTSVLDFFTGMVRCR